MSTSYSSAQTAELCAPPELNVLEGDVIRLFVSEYQRYLHALGMPTSAKSDISAMLELQGIQDVPENAMRRAVFKESLKQVRYRRRCSLLSLGICVSELYECIHGEAMSLMCAELSQSQLEDDEAVIAWLEDQASRADSAKLDCVAMNASGVRQEQSIPSVQHSSTVGEDNWAISGHQERCGEDGGDASNAASYAEQPAVAERKINARTWVMVAASPKAKKSRCDKTKKVPESDEVRVVSPIRTRSAGRATDTVASATVDLISNNVKKKARTGVKPTRWARQPHKPPAD